MFNGSLYICNGKVSALGIIEAKRSFMTVDISVLAEMPKFKGIDVNIWFALIGSVRMFEPIVAKLKKALSDSLRKTEMRKELEALDSTISLLNVDMTGFLKQKTAKHQHVVDCEKV